MSRGDLDGVWGLGERYWGGVESWRSEVAMRELVVGLWLSLSLGGRLGKED